MTSLFWRALLAFAALPGVIAFAVPLLLFGVRGRPFHYRGAPFVIVGCAVLLWCVRDFYVRGRGTLAPWAPPTRLVHVGLYRYTRNPMYVGVLLILVGWAIGFESRALGLYAGAIAIAFHLRVIFFEEPTLARAFPDDWAAYRHRVGRWLPHVRRG